MFFVFLFEIIKTDFHADLWGSVFHEKHTHSLHEDDVVIV